MDNRDYSISVVVPFFNEESSVSELHSRLSAVLKSTGRPYEMVLVNDGSRDATGDRLAELVAADAGAKVVELSGNWGQTAALAAGFANAAGDVIIAMDGDLQHAPEEIPLFLRKIEEGYDIVSGQRQGRRESLLLRRLPSAAANWLIATVSGVRLHDFGTTFKAYRREVLDRICLYGDFHRFVPALAKPLHARVIEIPISAPARASGASNYGIRRAFTVFFDMLRIRFLMSFLSRPLHFFGSAGFLLIGLGAAMGVFLVYEKYVLKLAVMTERGPFMMTAIFLLLAGMQMLSIGFLGEMMTRLYHETRPGSLYAVKEIKGQGLKG